MNFDSRKQIVDKYLPRYKGLLKLKEEITFDFDIIQNYFGNVRAIEEKSSEHEYQLNQFKEIYHNRMLSNELSSIYSLSQSKITNQEDIEFKLFFLEKSEKSAVFYSDLLFQNEATKFGQLTYLNQNNIYFLYHPNFGIVDTNSMKLYIDYKIECGITEKDILDCSLYLSELLLVMNSYESQLSLLI